MRPPHLDRLDRDGLRLPRLRAHGRRWRRQRRQRRHGRRQHVDMAPDVVGKFYSRRRADHHAGLRRLPRHGRHDAPAFMMAQPDLLQNLLCVPRHHRLIAAEVAPLYEGAPRGSAFTPDQLMTVGDWIDFLHANRAIGDGGDARRHLAVHAVDVGDEHDRSGGARPTLIRASR